MLLKATLNIRMTRMKKPTYATKPPSLCKIYVKNKRGRENEKHKPIAFKSPDKYSKAHDPRICSGQTTDN